MRIHLLSDLHLENAMMPRSYTPPDCDLVILAGDISPGLPGVVWAKHMFKDVPVIYVPGNHEYYLKRPMDEQLAKMRAEAAGSNIHILDNETMEFGGVRFIGTTLWADFDLYGQNFLHQIIAQKAMSDYYFAYTAPGILLTADDTLKLHQIARQFLTEELFKPFDGKTVVVTHHGPCEKSVHPRWHMHPVTPAFVSRLENLMFDFKPELWVHGHVHDGFDYVVDQTRVVANPRGYVPKENNGTFNDQLVLTI